MNVTGWVLLLAGLFVIIVVIAILIATRSRNMAQQTARASEPAESWHAEEQTDLQARAAKADAASARAEKQQATQSPAPTDPVESEEATEGEEPHQRDR